MDLSRAFDTLPHELIENNYTNKRLFIKSIPKNETGGHTFELAIYDLLRETYW